MKQLSRRVKYEAVLNMMKISTPHLVILLMFSVDHIVMGNELTLSKTFAVITLVQLLRIAIFAIPGIMLVSGAYVSLKRLDAFFAGKEQTEIIKCIDELNEVNIEDLQDMDEHKHVVFMRNATFKTMIK